MSGDKCAYFNCSNTRRTSKNKFYVFPTNDESLRKSTVNSGKKSLFIILFNLKQYIITKLFL